MLIDLSRSSMFFSRPALSCMPVLIEIKSVQLQQALLELNTELDQHAASLALDPNEQLRELTAAIAAPRSADTANGSKEELLSKLLGVATGACNRIDAEVSTPHFAEARLALHALKAALKEVYMVVCIPY